MYRLLTHLPTARRSSEPGLREYGLLLAVVAILESIMLLQRFTS
jgi:hypothetical protein